MFKRYSMLLWILLRNMRPVPAGRLLPALVLISVWTALRQVPSFSDIPEPMAFVLSLVVAEAYILWRNLPAAVETHGPSTGTATPAMFWGIGLVAALALAQIWLADPIVSQRILSGACALYVLVMALGIAGDEDVLNHFAPDEQDICPMVVRRHLLKLYALVAFTLLVLNESLIAAHVPLDGRIVMLALAPLALHVFYEIVLVLTLPLHGDEEGT